MVVAHEDGPHHAERRDLREREIDEDHLALDDVHAEVHEHPGYGEAREQRKPVDVDQLFEIVTHSALTSPRHAAQMKLMQLKAIEDIEQLQKAIDGYAERRGARVTSWRELVAAGALRSVPNDPSGVPYVLSPEGRVQLSDSSTLIPLPLEPRKRPGA